MASCDNEKRAESAAAGVDRNRQEHWLLFCSVVDNFGDVGVCWRLARQLVSEHAVAVTLFVDDWQACLDFLDQRTGMQDGCFYHDGVEVVRWRPMLDWSQWACVAVVIEAFGCRLPESLISVMASTVPPPAWFNLEYLSAESWVVDFHGRHSPQSVPGDQSTVMMKTFYFPGFVRGTGGLLRERGLLERHRDWQAHLEGERARLVSELGIAAANPGQDALWLSLFAYDSPREGAALPSWLSALSNNSQPSICLVPEGRVVPEVARALSHDGILEPGSLLIRGSLTLVVIPFLAQDDYDRLLSLCDLNIVRGEDSFVRAQWAARPLVWHIYPQEADAHLIKLTAFWDIFTAAQVRGGPSTLLARFSEQWNLGADCQEIWHDLRPQLPDLTLEARNWQQKLAELPDLASSLVQFYRNQP